LIFIWKSGFVNEDKGQKYKGVKRKTCREQLALSRVYGGPRKGPRVETN